MDDVSCRIVVVSSTLAKGDLLVQKLKHLSSKSTTPFEPVGFEGKDDGRGGFLEPVSIPWSISNRYYNADVHFSLHSLSRAYPAVFKGVPALIVTWSQGEPIQEYMKNLRKAMGHNEPEVLLGVCLPGDSATVDYEINDEDLDSTLMSHGFEYIDGSRPLNPDKNLRDDEDDGIPNLPRVLDALSAFMWPSMSTQTVPDEDEEGSPRSQVRSQPTLEHIINRDPFAILQALEELDTEFGFDDSNEDDEYHETLKELAAMEQEFPDAPPSFPSMIADDTMTSSPTEEGAGPSSDLSKPFGLSEVSLKHKVSLRFDDDFSAFVTAPPEDNHTPSKDLAPLRTHSGRESPDYDRLHSADPWSPFSQNGSLYHSLGSVSDLGDVDGASPEGKQVVD